jgi:hypothetical protein
MEKELAPVFINLAPVGIVTGKQPKRSFNVGDIQTI